MVNEVINDIWSGAVLWNFGLSRHLFAIDEAKVADENQKVVKEKDMRRRIFNQASKLNTAVSEEIIVLNGKF